eukprot:scpid24552/ scgid0050/ 
MACCYRNQGTRHMTWSKIPVANVSSADASEKTLRQREATIKQLKEAISGGTAESVFAQDAHSLKVRSKDEKNELLKEAGCAPKTLPDDVRLAIKADLQLPWSGLRKLTRYMKGAGVPIESEHRMRDKIKASLPFDLECREELLVEKSGTLKMCPVASFADLKGIILHYIHLNEDARTHEVWVKIGGDFGDESFKFCFQIANVVHPNSTDNTVPFLIFKAKDNASNLDTLLKAYHSQIKELASGKVTWKGRVVNLYLFVDYEFMCKVYGISGASGVRSCLFCLATKTDMQTADSSLQQRRTLEQLAGDNARFQEAGSILAQAKNFHNVTGRPLSRFRSIRSAFQSCT